MQQKLCDAMWKIANIAAIIILLCGIQGCATGNTARRNACKKPYAINGKTYQPMQTVAPGYTSEGTASWYGPGFSGKPTSSGEIYNMHAMTAAHPTLPMNCLVRVRNMLNGRETTVRVNDRGPFVSDRLIDLSFAAAGALEMIGGGVAPVRLTVLEPGTEPTRSATVYAATCTSPNPFFVPAGASNQKGRRSTSASLGVRGGTPVQPIKMAGTILLPRR